MQLGRAEYIPESQVLRWAALTRMVYEHSFGSTPIGSLDLLPDVFSLLITDLTLICDLSTLSLLLNVVPIGERENSCRN